ncbi:hypothetical protein GQ53DRAFT_735558 [Thozetella sp. PMI_491]|nr:hypothetical protein GQ53DRAFT_735558 [Thozetella sp. PMI_491]
MGLLPRLRLRSLGLSILLFLSVTSQNIDLKCPWDPIALFRRTTCDGPVDDESQIPANYPWDYAPFCRVLASVGSDEKQCVYSMSAFNDNSGISIIAPPDIAASLVDAVQRPTAAWNARHHIARNGEPPSPRSGEARLPYVVKHVPGKGTGVVATRKIEQFEVLMMGFPAMIVDNAFFPSMDSDEGLDEGTRLFQKALDQLSDQPRFTSLAVSRGGDVHIVEDVIRTNAFGTWINGKGFKGLYPEIALLSRTDLASAYPRFTRKDLAMEVRATRDIQPGEEITISYIGLGMPTKYRTEALENWGFNCTCAKCTAAPDEKAKSDARLFELVRLNQMLSKRDADYEYAQVVELTRRFVDIVQEENLFAKVGEYYQTFMTLFYFYGDIESAIKYGRTALRYAEMFTDPEGGFCGGIRLDLELLEEQWESEEGRADEAP